MLTTIQDFLSHNPIAGLSVIIFTVIIIAGLGRVLKQPLIIGYVIAGIVLGGEGLSLLGNQEGLETFGHLGVSLLIFMVGMGLNPKIIRELAGVSVIVGLTQVLVTGVVGYGMALLLGFDMISSIYIALGLAFSSTIVVVKLLSDKGDTTTLYGKIVLGVLIIQDILALLALMVIGTTTGSGVSSLPVFQLILLFVGKAAALFGALFLITRFVFPKLIKRMAKSPEYLFMFAFGRCLVMGTLFEVAGFSMEIGALLAGATLATSSYRHVIMSKMKSLRDFFVAMFFVFLGSEISFNSVYTYGWALLAFSVFVLIGRPILIMAIMGSMYYKKKNFFMSGVTLAQVSEFGPIIVALGIAAGHITNEAVLSIVTIIGLITMLGSNYLYNYSGGLFKLLQPVLRVFERHGKKVEDRRAANKMGADGFEMMVFGYGRIGKKIVESLTRQGKKFIVVDSDPEVIEELKDHYIPCVYGDANELDLFDEIETGNLKMVIATMNDFDGSMTLINTIKEMNQEASLILVANDNDDAMEMYEAGADYVIIPHDIGAHHTLLLLEDYNRDEERFVKEKLKHIEALHKH